MAEGPGITRQEAKAVTRARLLEAALLVLDDVGESGLTTTSVTRAAGMAQSSFYVHFTDMDDLLHNLVDGLSAERRRQARTARRRVHDGPGDDEALREGFRVPVTANAAHPRLFHLLVRSRSERSSPLGAWSRALHAESRAGRIDGLHALGLPAETERDRRVAEMVADGIGAVTECLTFGHLEGRYPDVEEVVDVLVAFSQGSVPLLRRARDEAATTAPG
jgi:AcrR family transcriptional regulator